MARWIYWCAAVVVGIALGAGAAAGVLKALGFGSIRPSGNASIRPAAATLAAAGITARVAQPPSAASTEAPLPEATPAPPKSLFESEQIVSYYGHPLAAGLGALGEGPEEQMLARLRKQVAAYQAINSEKTVVPALHLIYAVAQRFTSDDGLYLYHTDDATVQHFIQLTRDQHMLLFLDLQIGRSSLDAELQRVMPYLMQPHVHLAIDPEFVTPAGLRPGLYIGSLDCLVINDALDKIETMVEQQGLPNKIVIVHQFEDDMLTNKDKLRFDEPRVDLVLDMDGFGDQAGKLSKYDTLVRQFGAKYAGIKLFYKQDTRLLSEQQIEDLDPRPNLIIYQ